LAALKGLGVSNLDFAAVSGSGLAHITDALNIELEIPYDRIDGYPAPTIPGHPGRLVVGMIDAARVGVFLGRSHYYEGVSGDRLTLPVQLAAGLGARGVVLTTAVGGVNRNYRAGDIMLVDDHLNLMGANPLLDMIAAHPGNAFAPKHVSPFVPLNGLYRADPFATLRGRVEAAGGRIHRGVLAVVRGPNYETPAEVRMLRTLGGDVVCMSTVPEAIYARYVGLEVAALACVTNVAIDTPGGVGPSHEEVLDNAGAAAKVFALAFGELIKLL
jgi:purine-nucleoside phosphorylase